MTDSTELIRALVALIGPPGEERAVRDWLKNKVRELGYLPETDAKGNLIVRLPSASMSSSESLSSPALSAPSLVVMAHMDEIALMITKIESDGKIRVAPTGGVFTWKWGEGTVSILAHQSDITGILSFGSIHTNAEGSVVQYAREHALNWERAYVFTGLSVEALTAAGVRPGLRVVLAPSRRIVTEFGPNIDAADGSSPGSYIGSYFLDDRADLAAWLLALEALRDSPLEGAGDITFLATTSEEVGGEGAKFYLRSHPTAISVALELGPKTPEADFPIDAHPTIWVRDGYAAMEAVDGEILAECCRELGQSPHWQYLSRGGSDASCAAAAGLTARPVTLGLPMENSHGYEIMHRDAPGELSRLLLAYLRAVTSRASE